MGVVLSRNAARSSARGGRAHTFTIKFDYPHPHPLSRTAEEGGSGEKPPKQAPCLDGSLAFNMTDTGEMASMVFEVPSGGSCWLCGVRPVRLS